MKCAGHADENGNPECDGPDVLTRAIALPGGRKFTANLCAVCSNEVAQYATEVKAA